MTENGSISPEDILLDKQDTTFINGRVVRKGSVAAFLANINFLENRDSSAQHNKNKLPLKK